MIAKYWRFATKICTVITILLSAIVFGSERQYCKLQMQSFFTVIYQVAIMVVVHLMERKKAFKVTCLLFIGYCCSFVFLIWTLDLCNTDSIIRKEQLMMLYTLGKRHRFTYMIQCVNVISFVPIKHSYGVFSLIFIGSVIYPPMYVLDALNKNSVTVYFLMIILFCWTVLMIGYQVQGTMAIFLVYHQLNE